MMGQQPPRQEKLFYPAVSLEQRVRLNHPLRHIVQAVDFDFIYAEVASRYGAATGSDLILLTFAPSVASPATCSAAADEQGDCGVSREKKVVIIAGPNEVGKTTFATEFQKRMRGLVLHCNRP